MAVKIVTTDISKRNDPKYTFLDSMMDKECRVDFDFAIIVLLLCHKYQVSVIDFAPIEHGYGVKFRIKGMTSQIYSLNAEAKNEIDRQKKVV